jgi:hypothetical protein
VGLVARRTAAPQQGGAAAVSTQQPLATSGTKQSSAQQWRESGATCLTCNIGVHGPGFSSLPEQREHFRSDWHRFNIKKRLAKQPAVSEEQFEKLLEQHTEVRGWARRVA